MKRAIGAAVIGAAVCLASGCGQASQPGGASSYQTLASVPQPGGGVASASAAPINPAAAAEDRIVARVDGEPITMRQLMQPLVEAHGLTMLLNMARLDLVRQAAHRDHLVVSPQDIEAEQDLTLARMFKDSDLKEQDQLLDAERKGQNARAQQLRDQIRKDREVLLKEYLQQKNYSRNEYDLVIEINAYLRKMAERQVAGKITDKLVQDEFGIEYGETAQVRYIQLSNLNEVNQARQRLAAGEKFRDVARDMSRNARTAEMGGLLPAFSRQSPNLKQVFKDLAFSLQPGQVSDALNLDGNYFLVKLVQKFPPKAVKFADVKDSLRKSMIERVVEGMMETLRNGLNLDAMTKVQVEEPVLARQFEEIKTERDAAMRDRQKISDEMRRERLLGLGARPATAPSPATAPAATTQP